MRFRLTFVLWVFAIFASAMALAGAVVGIVLAGFIVVGRLVWHVLSPWSRLIAVVAILSLFFVLAVLPTVQVSRSSPILTSRFHMEHLSMAMRSYREDHKGELPAYTVNDKGNRLHSWRTLLLPYVEEPNLHKLINHNEPWDSSANKKLLNGLELIVYWSPRNRTRDFLPEETHYLGIIDDNSMGDAEAAGRLLPLKGEPAKQIVLIECAGRGIRWYEPRDLSLDEAVDLLSGKTTKKSVVNYPGFFTSRCAMHDGPYPRLVAMADGEIAYFYSHPTSEEATAMLTGEGAKHVNPEDFMDYRSQSNIEMFQVVHWDHIWGVVFLVVTSLLPMRWFITLKPARSKEQDT